MNRQASSSAHGEQLIAHYRFDDAGAIGKDSSGFGREAAAEGTNPPVIRTVSGRPAAEFAGGASGTSYLRLPAGLLKGITDATGVTISAWVYLGKGGVWERIFDFGKGPEGPYFFLTRNLRGVCHAEGDLVADGGKTYPGGEWLHIAMAVSGTEGGTRSSAGPVVYVNGEAIGDGTISQTSSGMYAKLRAWFATFSDMDNYGSAYIGKSQYAADADFAGSIADFRIYAAGFAQDEVIAVMCESLTDEEIVHLARDKYLSFPGTIITGDIELPNALMGGKAHVAWNSSHPRLITGSGGFVQCSEPTEVIFTAALNRGSYTALQSYRVTLVPSHLAPYTLHVDGDRAGLAVSPTMYGLFYEDINNAADGGIYAELVQNRSFESFEFDTYSHASGACGCSTGRNRKPLHAWSGDLDLVSVRHEGGLNEHLGLADAETNTHYVTVQDGATLLNRGFADTNAHCAMFIREGSRYLFTVWAKADRPGAIGLELRDEAGRPVSTQTSIAIEGGGHWRKYGVESPIALRGASTGLSQLALVFEGEISVDMVSLVPADVWGAEEETRSATAHANYAGNPNYRLRRDLVEALLDLHPTFLRFPGGCISEGSFIWDNVYDWKDSVGEVERRKENFNVWGYMMTMGLGYMEYFQLAEDLNATPLPVMACGVLCQARSDYVHPAGGALRDYYVKNFTDLIDFAISIDFDGNEWAAMRRSMGHEAPFDLRYLGVGNENWGAEFFASFEHFKAEIDAYMERYYPGYELHIISTVGAQADDDAFQQGWKFLAGGLTGTASVTFTDGKTDTEETISWYDRQPNYMDTIADEHYYRSNDYLLNNADRYNYYYRVYNPDGTLNERETSKVFVGEYASTDKNTLAGAIAEAALMTGFENNADVVRLAATAPLFNKVLTDGTYRWTPDCIWFDDETVWYTPNYYAQRLFAKYLGTETVPTRFASYQGGELTPLIPRGGIEIAAGGAEVRVKRIKVTSNADGAVLLEQDFREPLHPDWSVIPGSAGYAIDAEDGLVLQPQAGGRNGIYLYNDQWTNYKVEAEATRLSDEDGIYIGVGVTAIETDRKDAIEYAVGYAAGDIAAVKVFKRGVEGYTLGDYSSSTAAGNLRACGDMRMAPGRPYTVTVDYGGGKGNRLVCSFTDGDKTSRVLDYKLESYNHEIFSSVTRDREHVYVKLVNPDSTSKGTKLQLHGIAARQEGKVITLSGDETLLYVPNVNRKGDERVAPRESVLHLNGSETEIQLPPYSVTVAVLRLA
ncbi:alpha-L-arabinofuranosidase C-terminal domain-containing protein [Paenibacillus methanolicus]|uniref:non-reducing end alpha-L-arabinofuranosidase n=1 Tax=Paenibacillus methanolicus TaxID=582686 RepID=A0A5S5C1X5_9BACL|nr:alpha-L-arabinofuranosidase C-terminal domain-containing protein [Paenibacillus methanolicus]TYP72350.1 concanavalin A-like lectin/glucanase superfamily protein [Paenibacillus methanolicus]